MLPYLIAASVAMLVSLLVVPPTIRLARAFDLLDAPDAVRRLHHLAVPRLGGIAVWLGVATGLLCVALLPAVVPGVGWTVLTSAQQQLVAGLGGALVVMLVTGLADDVRGLRPLHKLVAQLLAALLVVAAGFRIDTIALSSGVSLDLGWVAVPATLLWLVGVTNAFNLIDGLDGLAGGVALVVLGTVAVSGALLGNPLVLAVAAPLAGGIVGFLRYNTARPSRIFLGDVGSLTIGFALAVLTIEGARHSTGQVVASVPLFALAFPLLDTAIAMLRRWLRGVPLSGADGRHLHHQLVCLGLSRGRAAAAICALSAFVAALGLSVAFAPPTVTLSLALLAGAAAVVFLIHGLRWLGYHEFAEAQASFASGLFKARSVIRDRILAREFDVRIRDVSSPTALEGLLAEVTRTFGFEKLSLTGTAGDRLELPLRARDRRIFRLDCPINAPEWAGDDGFVLRVWWREDSRQPPLYAERIVRILAPAIEAALANVVRPAEELPLAALAHTGNSTMAAATAARRRGPRPAISRR